MSGRFERPRTPAARDPAPEAAAPARARREKRQKKTRPRRVRQRHVWTVRQKVLLVLCAVLACASAVSGMYFRRATHALITQSAAEAWRGQSELRFAQAAAYLPVDEPKTEDDIRAFRDAMARALNDASLEAPENGRLWDDAFCAFAKLELSGPGGTCSVTAVGVGGDFFLFHPLHLRAGSYLTADDYMADRLVLDEQSAWALFGGLDVAGMGVQCGTREYPVAGVVARETDFATRRACTDVAMVYMSYDALKALTEAQIQSYEVVMPEPISGFAMSVMRDHFPVGDGVLVDNTRRYSLKNLWTVLKDFGVRSMNTHAVIYPYWENAARMTEDHAALALLLCVLFGLFPVVSFVVVTVKYLKMGVTAAAESAAEAIEERVEEEKEKHYVRTGI